MGDRALSTSENLISYLKNNRGRWVSGEGLSRELSVTRAAVSKHIGRLRREGYEIESSPRKGYRFQQASPRLLPREIQEGLKTRVFGRGDIHYFEETDSTNSRALALAASGAPEGTLVVAESQTRGRGRMGRDWHSPGNAGIYLSLILRPPIPPMEAPKMTLLAGVAGAEALREFARVDAHIKWPNDLLIGSRKVAGILTEIASDMDRVNHVVTGMGLNVSTREFPPGIRDIATSLFLETGRDLERAALARAFLERYEQAYDLFLKGGAPLILERWKAMSRTLGSSFLVEIAGERVRVLARDMEPDGSLLVETGDGQRHQVFSGDLEAVKK